MLEYYQSERSSPFSFETYWLRGQVVAGSGFRRAGSFRYEQHKAPETAACISLSPTCLETKTRPTPHAIQLSPINTASVSLDICHRQSLLMLFWVARKTAPAFWAPLSSPGAPINAVFPWSAILTAQGSRICQTRSLGGVSVGIVSLVF